MFFCYLISLLLFQVLHLTEEMAAMELYVLGNGCRNAAFAKQGILGMNLMNHEVKLMNPVSLSSFLITLANPIVSEGRETPSGNIFRGNTDALNSLQIGLSSLLMLRGE